MDKGPFIKVDGAYRVADIALMENRLIWAGFTRSHPIIIYVERGGDGMVMFGGCNVIQDDVMVDVDILSAYINNQLGSSVGAD